MVAPFMEVITGLGIFFFLFAGAQGFRVLNNARLTSVD